MSITVYIVDDQPHGVKAVTNLANKIKDLKIVGTNSDSVDAFNEISSGTIKVDILFLDVDMPVIDGMDFLEQLGNKVVTIFVTAHDGFALKSYRLGAVDYLTKPIQEIDFIKAINKAKEILIARAKLGVPDNHSAFIFIRHGVRNFSKLILKDLIYIKADDKFLYLYVGQPKPIEIRRTLTSIEKCLPKDKFMRVHNSYLVNLSYVDSIVGKSINMQGSFVIPIGGEYVNEVFSRFDSI